MAQGPSRGGQQQRRFWQQLDLPPIVQLPPLGSDSDSQSQRMSSGGGFFQYTPQGVHAPHYGAMEGQMRAITKTPPGHPPVHAPQYSAMEGQMPAMAHTQGQQHQAQHGMMGGRATTKTCRIPGCTRTRLIKKPTCAYHTRGGCIVPGCKRPRFNETSDKCRSHTLGKCARQGCRNSAVYTSGFCNKCKPTCSVDGCTKHARQNGRCHAHNDFVHGQSREKNNASK